MPEKQQPLYVSDLDGTLLQDDGTLSADCRRSLCELLEQGLPFTVASARSVFSMQEILQGLPIRLPIISTNGGFISDLNSGQHFAINAVKTDIASELLHLIDDSGNAPWVSAFDGRQDRLYYNRIANGGMQWYLEDRQHANDTRLTCLEDISVSLGNQVICLIVMGKEAPVANLRQEIVARFGTLLMTQFYENRYSPGWHWLSIHDAGATKGNALRYLVDHWELHDRELVVFGDAENDIEMFQTADRAIAVANAEDPLKPHASSIIAPSNTDSVIRFIARDWKPPTYSPN